MKKSEWTVEPSTVDIHEEMNKAVGLNNVKTNQTLVLTISSKCHNHIKSLHNEYPNTEWLAICKTEKVWEWHFRVIDMLHPQQKWVGAEVETTADWMRWLMDYLKEHNEPLEQWNLVMHSHHHMWVFRSWTDDNARLWLNDGRDLMWAVVTAYTKEWKTMKVDYKWCVNFYTPYNIEIDCHIDAEEDWGYERLRKLYNKHKEWEEKVNERWEELYEQLLTTQWVKADFSAVENYLWMDIHEELTKNYYKISKFLPDADKTFYETLEQQALWQAISEIPWIDIPNELLEWDDWDNALLEQLKEARNIPVPVKDYTKAYDWKIVSQIWFVKDDKEVKKQNSYEINTDYMYFNDINFPDEMELRQEYSVPKWVDLSIDWNWMWLVYDWNTSSDIPFGQWLEEWEQDYYDGRFGYYY